MSEYRLFNTEIKQKPPRLNNKCNVDSEVEWRSDGVPVKEVLDFDFLTLFDEKKNVLKFVNFVKCVGNNLAADLY